MTEILDIVYAEPSADFCLRLRFSDGRVKEVDVRGLLQGPIFEPVRDPEYFRSVTLDQVLGTVVWPNGADLAPEALRELPDLKDRTR